MKLFEVTNTTWENLQIATHTSVLITPHLYFVLSNVQIFSGCVCHLEQLHAHYAFLFPIVFGTNLIPFFRLFAQYLLYFHPGCLALCSFTWATARSQLLPFVVLAGGFGVSLRAATSNLPSPPNPLSNGGVPRDWRKHTRPSSFHNPTLSANKHVVQSCRYSLSAAVQTIQFERRTSPFNGIERSLSRAVVIKTKSLSVSATTFPTALSLYMAHEKA